MPFRSEIEFIPNTAYNFLPPGTWEIESYNQLLKRCDIIDTEYCTKVNTNEPFTIQFRPEFIEPNLMPTAFLFSDAATATTSGKAEATGIGSVAAVNQLIYNFTTGQSTYVTGIDSANVVSVADDIFTIGDGVILFDYQSQEFTVSIDQNLGYVFCRQSGAGNSTLTLPGVLNNGSYYYVSVYVSNYTGGALEVKLGTEIIGTITANGQHDFYGRSNGTEITFACTSSQDFEGCLQLTGFESYEVFEGYYLDTLDKDLTVLNSDAIVALTNYQINNGVASFDFEYTDECTCLYLAITKEYTCTNLIANGNFESFDGWESSNPKTVQWDSVNDTLQFKGAAQGDSATYTDPFLCPLVCGLTYKVTFGVTDYISGNLVFNVGGSGGGVNITGNDSYSFTIILGEDCTQEFSISAALGGASMNIDRIVLQYEEDQFERLGTSELLCICAPDPCEMQIKFRNDVDAFGYTYPEGVQNTINICARLRNATIQFNEFLNNKDTFGNYSAIYANVDKSEELVTEWIPPYMANALTVALAHSEVLIKGVPYVLRSTFTSNSSDDTEMQKITATVVKADQRYTQMTRK